MSDLISREALINIFEERMHDDNVMCPIIKVLDVLEIVDDAPTVEAKEVVHGEWIEHGEDTKGNNPIECPMCRYLYARLYPKNFCPNCGADMRKKVQYEQI